MAKNNAPKRRKPVPTQVYGAVLGALDENVPISSVQDFKKIKKVSAQPNGSLPNGIIKALAERNFHPAKNAFGETIIVGEVQEKGQTIVSVSFDREVERCINSPVTLKFFCWFLTKFAESDKQTTEFKFPLRELAKDFNISRQSAYDIADKATSALLDMKCQYYEKTIKKIMGWKKFHIFPSSKFEEGIISISISPDCLTVLKQYSTMYFSSDLFTINPKYFPYAIAFTLLIESHRRINEKKACEIKNRLRVSYLVDKNAFPKLGSLNYELKRRLLVPFINNMDATGLPWRLVDNVGRPIKRYKGKNNSVDMYLDLSPKDLMLMSVETINPLDADELFKTKEGRDYLLGFYHGNIKSNTE